VTAPQDLRSMSAVRSEADIADPRSNVG